MTFTAGEFLDSLKLRIRALNWMWTEGAADLTLPQVNHKERDGVLPIAFTLSHYVRHQDMNVARWFHDRPTIWDAGGWVHRVGATVDLLGREESLEQMEPLRFGDYDAWLRYQALVFEQTADLLDHVTEADLVVVVMDRLAGTHPSFPRAVAGDRPFRRIDVLELFTYQHGLRHLGELDHARALVGLHGVPVH